MSIEAMKLALEYLEESDNYLGSLDHSKPIAALRQAIEQAEKQEPVAWITLESKWRLKGGGNAGGTVPVHAKQSNTSKYPLYTTPQPQRKWVGLTDDEIDKCCDFPLNALGMKNVRKIEAKLRSKNK